MPTNTGGIDAFYAGSSPVDKLYVGSTEIWSAYTPPPPIAYVGIGTTFVSAFSGSCAAPAGSLTGDLLVLVECTVSSSNAPTKPASFTLQGSNVLVGTFGQAVSTRIATGNGAANDVVVSQHDGGAARKTAYMMAFRNATAVDKFAIHASGSGGATVNQGPNPNQLEMPQFTPNADATYLLAGMNMYQTTDLTASDPARSDSMIPLVTVYHATGNGHMGEIVGKAWAGATPTASPVIIGNVVGGIASGFIMSLQ